MESILHTLTFTRSLDVDVDVDFCVQLLAMRCLYITYFCFIIFNAWKLFENTFDMKTKTKIAATGVDCIDRTYFSYRII